jgi:hypothetical protein
VLVAQLVVCVHAVGVDGQLDRRLALEIERAVVAVEITLTFVSPQSVGVRNSTLRSRDKIK